MCSGEVRLAGSVALVPQEPWVFSGTIRDNILFGFKYEKERYAQVLHASSLQKVRTYVRVCMRNMVKA